MEGLIITSAKLAPVAGNAARAPEGWREVRGDPDIQFEPIVTAPPPPSEPGWLARQLDALFELMGNILSPLGSVLGGAWPVLKWVLLASLVLFVVVLLARTIGPLARRIQDRGSSDAEPEWQPAEEESLALLADADRLAHAGRFEEAVRLLLHRSVGQIAAAMPSVVEPSSTARELSVVSALPETARTAFAAIAERVERGVFALRALDRSDWEAARTAYAEFALTRIGGAV